MTMCQPARPEEVKSWSGVGVGRSRMAEAALKKAARSCGATVAPGGGNPVGPPRPHELAFDPASAENVMKSVGEKR